MKFSRAWLIVTLLFLLVVLISLTGCANSRITIHPITEQDIFDIKAGTVVNGQTIRKDGWFLSSYYVEEIMRVKIDGDFK